MRGRKKGVVCPRLIRKAIRRAGNQSALARALGLTRQAISTWIKGKTRPSPRYYAKLLAFAGAR